MPRSQPVFRGLFLFLVLPYSQLWLWLVLAFRVTRSFPPIDLKTFCLMSVAVDVGSADFKQCPDGDARIAAYHNLISFSGVHFWVPFYPFDYIQRMLVKTANFFEPVDLQLIDRYLLNDAIIFDIGSNIGNHVIYWALRRHAKRNYAFEPVPVTFAILTRNVQLNRLEDVIVPINIAIGDTVENLSVMSWSPMNIGMTILQSDQRGTIPAIPLDRFRFPEQRVNFVKIDVEGFEIRLLIGSREFFMRYRPKWVFIETQSISRLEWTKAFFASVGMTLAESLPWGNFLFVRNESLRAP
jgi:FkbM family methyltransferase